MQNQQISPPPPTVSCPEWCEHAPRLVIRDDGGQELRCAICNYIFHAWSEPVRIEHFDHA